MEPASSHAPGWTRRSSSDSSQTHGQRRSSSASTPALSRCTGTREHSRRAPHDRLHALRSEASRLLLNARCELFSRLGSLNSRSASLLDVLRKQLGISPFQLVQTVGSLYTESAPLSYVEQGSFCRRPPKRKLGVGGHPAVRPLSGGAVIHVKNVIIFIALLVVLIVVLSYLS
jgi:hypothetical protein